MTINLDKISKNSDTQEICIFINKTIDMLNYALNNIDDKNLTEDFTQKIKEVIKL